jgi:hypothetical protein
MYIIGVSYRVVRDGAYRDNFRARRTGLVPSRITFRFPHSCLLISIETTGSVTRACPLARPPVHGAEASSPPVTRHRARTARAERSQLIEGLGSGPRRPAGFSSSSSCPLAAAQDDPATTRFLLLSETMVDAGLPRLAPPPCWNGTASITGTACSSQAQTYYRSPGTITADMTATFRKQLMA